MADEKDVPLRAAEVPQSAVPVAPGAAEPAAPEMADSVAVPPAGQEDEAVAFSRLAMSVPVALGITAEDFARTMEKLSAAVRGESPAAIGAVFWALAETWREVNVAIMAMEIHNRGPIGIRDLNVPGATDEGHDPRMCQCPGCRGKRGQA